MADNWSIVYKRAIEKNGDLLFPEKLSREFLENARKTMGSRLFSNQYLNVVIGEEDQHFHKKWFKYQIEIPEDCFHFAFIDPAIGQKDSNDYTAVVVIAVDKRQNWYVRAANRYRLGPTEIVAKCFEVAAMYKPMAIGIETVAYQQALMYLLAEEISRRGHPIPVTGISRTKVSKESRVLALVPRMEWGKLFMLPDQTDLEDEFLFFPRGKFDDLIDALASMEDIVFYPTQSTKEVRLHPGEPGYESQYIRDLYKRGSRNEYQEDDDQEGI